MLEVSDEMESVESDSIVDRIKLRITTAIGYLLPLIVSIPPMGVWVGLMTVPFIVYLILMMSNLIENPPFPNLSNPYTLTTTIIQIIAILFFIWSVVYLRKEKTEGLVTSGPYRFVRHPQYLSLIMLTALMTYQSVWILLHTDGFGWLSPDETKNLWILMLVAYAIIAVIEEMHLQKKFDSQWSEYRNRVGFFIPFVKYKSYVVKGTNSTGRMKALCAFLDRQGIVYGHASATSVSGIAYGSNDEMDFDVAEDDLVISAFQPRAVLAQILFDPASELVDSMTYDITSWALPFAYGVQAYASTARIDVEEGYEFDVMSTTVEQGAYAYVMIWNSVENGRMLGSALDLGLKPRFANKPFTVGGIDYKAGTVLFMQQDHHHIPAFYQHISQLQADGAGFTPVHTGFVESGSDFGTGC